jgi:hypothetical protein
MSLLCNEFEICIEAGEKAASQPDVFCHDSVCIQAHLKNKHYVDEVIARIWSRLSQYMVTFVTCVYKQKRAYVKRDLHTRMYLHALCLICSYEYMKIYSDMHGSQSIFLSVSNSVKLPRNTYTHTYT